MPLSTSVSRAGVHASGSSAEPGDGLPKVGAIVLGPDDPGREVHAGDGVGDEVLRGPAGRDGRLAGALQVGLAAGEQGDGVVGRVQEDAEEQGLGRQARHRHEERGALCLPLALLVRALPARAAVREGEHLVERGAHLLVAVGIERGDGVVGRELHARLRRRASPVVVDVELERERAVRASRYAREAARELRAQDGAAHGDGLRGQGRRARGLRRQHRGRRHRGRRGLRGTGKRHEGRCKEQGSTHGRASLAKVATFASHTLTVRGLTALGAGGVRHRRK